MQRFLASYEEGRETNKLDSLVYRVTRLYRILLAADNCGSDVLEAVGKSLTLLQDIHVDTQCGYVTSVLQEKRRGHPRLDVGQGLLKYLLHLEFSCLQIADVLGVSLSTIRRRMNEFGFSVTTLYSNITDQELDSLVSQIKEELPNCGSRLMHGHLLNRGHRITQARVREALHQVDPEGVAIHWSSVVQRRKYAVASPLSLWHIGENHKLIR